MISLMKTWHDYAIFICYRPILVSKSRFDDNLSRITPSNVYAFTIYDDLMIL